MTSKIIHFDTINGEDQQDETYSLRSGTTGQSLNISHNYFTKIPLTSPLTGVSNIELSSIEFPYTTYNIRAENGSNTLGLNFTYKGLQNSISCVLIPKNYTSISSLLTDINTSITSQIQLKTTLVGLTIELIVNAKDVGKIIIKSNCDGVMTVAESILARYVLGISFNKESIYSDKFIMNTTSNYTFLTASLNYNLVYDNYFCLNFINITHSGSANADAKVVTFKLPLSCPYNEVIYYTSGNNFSQCLMLESNKTVSHLMLKITDRFGFPVYSAGHCISFSLTFYF